jgi:hypothetical protein
MGKPSDFSRQRLADFLAARLKASRAEKCEAPPKDEDSHPASTARPLTTSQSDAPTRQAFPPEYKRAPSAGLGSSN